MARTGLTRSLLAQRNADEALAHIDILDKTNPNNPINAYLTALAFRLQRDIPEIQLALREVLNVASAHSASLLMHGAIHYHHQELELAETY